MRLSVIELNCITIQLSDVAYLARFYSGTIMELRVFTEQTCRP